MGQCCILFIREMDPILDIFMCPLLFQWQMYTNFTRP